MTVPAHSPTSLKRWRKDYFGSPAAALMTLFSLAVLAAILWFLIDWGLIRATFGTEGNQEACAAAGGACWSVIAVRWRVILFGIYPYGTKSCRRSVIWFRVR